MLSGVAERSELTKIDFQPHALHELLVFCFEIQDLSGMKWLLGLILSLLLFYLHYCEKRIIALSTEGA